MKLLKATYKTWESAYKRTRFENGLAMGEFLRGDKARYYHYRTVELDGKWRVERIVAELPQQQQ
jgi:hypothetical protein